MKAFERIPMWQLKTRSLFDDSRKCTVRLEDFSSRMSSSWERCAGSCSRCVSTVAGGRERLSALARNSEKGDGRRGGQRSKRLLAKRPRVMLWHFSDQLQSQVGEAVNVSHTHVKQFTRYDNNQQLRGRVAKDEVEPRVGDALWWGQLVAVQPHERLLCRKR